jgi:hypothetical protein
LRQAIKGIDQPDEKSLAEQVEQLADRAQGLSSEQQRVESELYEALGEAMNSPRDRGQLPSREAQKLIESKQKMADELGRVQQDMRAAINDHRGRSPEATRRLGQALSELEDANLSARLNRSAAEIRYGRAREAAPREGLIADALHALEENLRATARIANGESEKQDTPPGPEQLLARLGDLRRALQQAEAKQNGSGNKSSGAEGTRTDAGEQAGDTEGSRSAARWNANRASVSEQSVPSMALSDAQSLAQRLEDMAGRGTGLGLTAEQIEALRRLAHQVRQLKSSATSRLSALKLIDQLELAALSSAERSRQAPPARSSVTSEDDDQREVLAEYYRRLGGSCAASEGGRGC